MVPQIIKTYAGYGTLLCLIVSGFLLNITQLLLFIIVRPFSQNLFRQLNHYIQFSYWSQSVAVADWSSNLKCRIYYKDEESYKEFGTRSGIVIANHRYDIDWLAAWMLSDKLGLLGGDKAMLKSTLRYVPVIGWGWSLSDMIFLSRDWQKDKDNLAKATDILMTYPRSMILSYFEGTRLTKSKYEASVKFAEEKNLPIRLKNHLIPRTRGFDCMIRRIQLGIKRDSRIRFGLYNFQVALDDDDNSRASLTSVFGGTKTTVHIYIERLDVMKVPIDSEETTANYLYNVYKEKDYLVEYFAKNGRFPGIEKPYKPRLVTLINWLVWMVVIYVTIIYQYCSCIISGNPIYITVLTTIGLMVIFAIRMMLNSTKVSKSSSYGTKVTSRRNN